MENRRILSWQTWSPLRRGIVIGAVAGLAVTALAHLVCTVENVGALVAFGIYVSISFPAWCIYKVLGWEEATRGRIPWHFTMAVVLVNTCLLALFGGLIGQFIRRSKARQPKTPPKSLS